MSTDSGAAFAVRPAPPGFVYARQWVRFFALLIDSVVALVPLLLLFVFVVVVHGGGLDYADYLLDPAKSGLATALVLYALTSAALIGWFALWQATLGATPGMMILGLRVRGPNMRDAPSLPAAVIRNAVPILSNLNSITPNEDINMGLGLVAIGVYLAIGISIAESPTRQGFHDRLAGGTYVLRRAKAA
jgi:uncharacterized RDD family membrane protein YckC